MFNKRKQESQFSLNQFNDELAALIDRAIKSRHIHLKQISEGLEDSAEAVRLRWAIQTPVV